MPSTIRGDDNFDSSEAFTQNQSWTDVLGSRALDTDYTNNTGKAIQVLVSYTLNGSISTTKDSIVDGVGISTLTLDVAGHAKNLGAIIPDGSTYRINSGNITLTKWWELR